MSADGDHLGLVTPKGSRQVVMIDGAESPLFDDIPAQTVVQFSPTGGRSGCLGRRGGELIAVVDGKETGPVATATTNPGGPSAPPGYDFFFNRDGSHLAYGVMTGPASPLVGTGSGYTWVPREALTAAGIFARECRARSAAGPSLPTCQPAPPPARF